MKIPFLDFTKETELLIRNGIMSEIEAIFRSGHFLFGPKTKLLEEKLSELFNANAILVGSGTDALFLALRAFGIGFGSTVAIPAMTAIPTAAAVKLTGANIKYIDVNNALMDINKLNVLGKIDAVIVVHLYGNVANLKDIKEFCNNRRIPLIEDCAQSFGAKFNEKHTGTIGNAGALSFYPSKNLGAASDMGCVITKDVGIAQKIKELRFYGQVDKYVMGTSCGINSRADEIQCAVLLKKLEYMGIMENRRLELLYKYEKNLNNLPRIKWNIGCMPHLYPIFVENRKTFMRKMKENGIETLIHYPFSLPSAIDKEIVLYESADFISEHEVSIPFNPWMSDGEVEYVLEKTKKFIEGV